MPTRVVTYPGPVGEPESDLYRVRVNGEPVFVYQARVSAVPLNQVWPGYQRPIDQTELAAFAYWACDGPVTVEVESQRPVESVVVRPYSAEIQPTTEENRVSFTLAQPRYVTVEVNGMHHALHLFADPPEIDIPDPTDPKVHYYGPGVHRIGELLINSGETVYIAGGAVVHGELRAHEARDIRILGRGILDNSTFERDLRYGGAGTALFGCENVLMDGPILRDPNYWTVVPVRCRQMRLANLKLVGLWRYNSDGIDLVNCQHVVIERCFVRAFDDCIVLKGLKSFLGYPADPEPMEDILVRDCVIWNDWGRALEIGAETCAPSYRDITWRNCDVIHSVHVALDIQHGDRAWIENVRYEDIRIEMDDGAPRPVYQRERGQQFEVDPADDYLPRLFVAEIVKGPWSKDEERGHLRGVFGKNVAVVAPRTPPSVLVGYDPEHDVEDVTFQNLQINGEPVTDPEAGGFEIRRNVRGVRLVK